MTFSPRILGLAKRVIAALVQRGLTIATAESCTGGLIAGALTSVPGSSDAVYGGFVTYANAAKMAMIGVPQKVLNAHGAVSEKTVRAMAEGALTKSGCNIAVAVTGIAGPGGGTAHKPVGLVFIGCATRHDTFYRELRLGDLDRNTIRMETVAAALEMILDVIAADQP